MLLKFFLVFMIVGFILMAIGQRANKEASKFPNPNKTPLARVGYWMLAVSGAYFLIHLIFGV